MLSKTKRKGWAISLNIVALLGFIMLYRSIFEVDETFTAEAPNILTYFTIQSNIFSALWFLLLSFGLFGIRRCDRFARSPIVSGGVTLYITFTGIIYWAVLVPIFLTMKNSQIDGDFLFCFDNIWLHTFIPIATIFTYFSLPMNAEKNAHNKWLWLGYPIAYVIMAFVVAAITGLYVYPFFNPKYMGGIFMVAIVIVFLSCAFFGMGILYMKLHRREHIKEFEDRQQKKINKILFQSYNIINKKIYMEINYKRYLTKHIRLC